MTLHAMTFHESYGNLPTGLLTIYKRHNVSPADHDRILAAFDCDYRSANIPWAQVLDFVLAHCDNGVFRLPIYL